MMWVKATLITIFNQIGSLLVRIVYSTLCAVVFSCAWDQVAYLYLTPWVPDRFLHIGVNHAFCVSLIIHIVGEHINALIPSFVKVRHESV